jgi:transcription elongation factor GreA
MSGGLCMEKTYISKDGYEKLITDLEYLTTTKRREIAKQLDFARSFGDLRENAEYDAAKHALAMNETRIRELQDKISHAEIINTDNIQTDKIFIGVKVTLWDLDYEEEVDYELTGTEESDPSKGKISVNSPVAKALLGHSVDDIIEIKVPRGTLKYKVLKIFH